MSTGTQVDLNWAEQATPASVPDTPGTGTGSGAYLSDEEILGIDPPSPKGGFGGLARQEGTVGAATDRGDLDGRRQSTRAGQTANDGISTAPEMPAWIAALAGDPKVGPEAQALWSEHQAFRATFSSPDEARVIADEVRSIKEMFPGGAREAQSLREASQSVDRIDAAIFSGDARAQSEVVAEIALANPAAFRSLFAEAAKVLAGMGSSGGAGRFQSGQEVRDQAARPALHSGSGQALRENREGWGTQHQGQNQHQNHPPSPQDGFGGQARWSAVDSGTAHGTDRAAPFAETQGKRVTDHEARATGHAAPHPSQELRASQSPAFDPAAYASFERSTNDLVARDVRGSIGETLTRVLPDGVADGAAKRIGDDIFNEIHRALAADRSLSEQVGDVLRDRRFGSGEQQRVAALLAGRAKQLVPSVARRVIGEWTSSVLGTARSKAARQAAAASRVDIAAPGGSLDSMPLRSLSSREVNYASMSDDEILGM